MKVYELVLALLALPDQNMDVVVYDDDYIESDVDSVSINKPDFCSNKSRVILR